jgi:hypothetical protein
MMDRDPPNQSRPADHLWRRKWPSQSIDPPMRPPTPSLITREGREGKAPGTRRPPPCPAALPRASDPWPSMSAPPLPQLRPPLECSISSPWQEPRRGATNHQPLPQAAARESTMDHLSPKPDQPCPQPGERRRKSTATSARAMRQEKPCRCQGPNLCRAHALAAVRKRMGG